VGKIIVADPPATKSIDQVTPASGELRNPRPPGCDCYLDEWAVGLGDLLSAVPQRIGFQPQGMTIGATYPAICRQERTVAEFWITVDPIAKGS